MTTKHKAALITDITGQEDSFLAEFLFEKGYIVIATGMQYSGRSFLEKTVAVVSMQFRWEGTGVDDVGYWDSKPVIRIDPRYFRPTEVETLLDDPTKTKKNSDGCKKWSQPIWPVRKKHALLRQHGSTKSL